MNVVDLVLVLALAWVVVRGFRQGALSQVAGFAGAVAGLVGGAAVAPSLANVTGVQPGPNLALLTLGLLLCIVLLGQGVGLAIGTRLRAGAQRIGAGSADRAAGIAVGFGGFVITVWLLASVLVHGPSPSLAARLSQSRVVAEIASRLPPPPNVFGRVSTYLDQHGFPQVFAGVDRSTAPPIAPPASAAVEAAQRRGQLSTVQVEALGCGGIASGSGFVTQPGFIVTNAHVVAGGQSLRVRDRDGEHAAVAIHVDPAIDLAVLYSPDTTAGPIGWVSTPSRRGTAGATLGFPAGQSNLDVRPAVVQGRLQAEGRDIYGRQMVMREILMLQSGVSPGDSGGPFVTSEGQVGGVVFAAAASEPGIGYALTAEEVEGDVSGAIARNAPASTGECRY
ncbi:MAG: MarP family serine protease [Egibacteraceae bacterium]